MVSCQFAMHYMFEKEVSELYGLKYRVCYVVSSRMCLISSKWEDTSSQLSLIVIQCVVSFEACHIITMENMCGE